jgi:hypothetical protein
MRPNDRLAIAVFAGAQTSASTVFGLYDLFSSVGRDWDLLTKGEAGTPWAQPMIVADEADPFEAANGAWIRPDRTFKDCAKPDVICVPDLLVAPGESIAGRFDHAVAWLRQYYRPPLTHSGRLESVESRCGAAAVGRAYQFAAPFVRRCLSGSTMAPFPHPAHRSRGLWNARYGRRLCENAESAFRHLDPCCLTGAAAASSREGPIGARSGSD